MQSTFSCKYKNHYQKKRNETVFTLSESGFFTAVGICSKDALRGVQHAAQFEFVDGFIVQREFVVTIFIYIG